MLIHSLLEDRFNHIRKVIGRLEQQEQEFEQAVVERFAALDMEGIYKIAKLRDRNRKLRSALQRFLVEYEHKKW